ncbi:MAG: DUF3800 domain-containing protein [Dyadobacter sp.]|uniref:DUF3800 domain-containing protein n=1 Tax=Dyadobacter sp. TaxID=1914288 RepID=UPI003267EA8D
MQNQIAYLSEWGNSELDFKKQGQVESISTHFIVTALLVNKSDLPEIIPILEAVRTRYFGGASIGSEAVGNDHEKRKQILEDLDEIGFKIIAIIVDKRQLVGQGLHFKGSLFKFLHGLTDRELYSIYPDLEMSISLPMDESFMKGFIGYVQQNHISNLFNQSDFGFAAIQETLMVQTASFIAETLARCYDETVITDQRGDFIEILKSKVLSVKFWPDTFEHTLANKPEPGPSYDPLLAELSIKLANGFFNRKSSDRAQQAIDQISCLGYLLFHFKHINPTRYITSFELIEHVRARRGKNVSLHYFQTKVIAPLRDAGVLIASSSRGYKLPASHQDLYDFIGHSNTIIEPMLSRVKKFRDQIVMATDGKLDVLAADEFKLIRKVVL